MEKALKRYSKEESEKYFKEHGIDTNNSILLGGYSLSRVAEDILKFSDGPESIYTAYENELKKHNISDKAEFMRHYYSYLYNEDMDNNEEDLMDELSKSNKDTFDNMQLLEVPFVYKVAIELDRRVNKKVKDFRKWFNSLIWIVVILLTSVILTKEFEPIATVARELNSREDYCIECLTVYWWILILFSVITVIMLNNDLGILNGLTKPVVRLFESLCIHRIKDEVRQVSEYVEDYEHWNSAYNFFTDKFYSEKVALAKELIMSHEYNLSKEDLFSRVIKLNPCMWYGNYNWEVFKTFKFAEMFVGNNWRRSYLLGNEIYTHAKSLKKLESIRRDLKELHLMLDRANSKLCAEYTALFRGIVLNKIQNNVLGAFSDQFISALVEVLLFSSVLIFLGGSLRLDMLRNWFIICNVYVCLATTQGFRLDSSKQGTKVDRYGKVYEKVYKYVAGIDAVDATKLRLVESLRENNQKHKSSEMSLCNQE